MKYQCGGEIIHCNIRTTYTNTVSTVNTSHSQHTIYCMELLRRVLYGTITSPLGSLSMNKRIMTKGGHKLKEKTTIQGIVVCKCWVYNGSSVLVLTAKSHNLKSNVKGSPVRDGFV